MIFRNNIIKPYYIVVFDRIEKEFNMLSNKVVIIKDIDIQWKKWDRITKSIMLLIGQHEKFSLLTFSVTTRDKNNNKIIFFFNV